MGTNIRTDERTEVNPKVHRLRRETKNQIIVMNQGEYKPVLQWFVKYDVGKDLKANKN